MFAIELKIVKDKQWVRRCQEATVLDDGPPLSYKQNNKNQA